MVASVNTGVPMPGGVVDVAGQERQSANTFFTILDTGGLSHQFNVSEIPWYIKAFGLGDAALVQVVMCTNTNTGEVQEDMYVNGRAVGLIKHDNVLIIDIPGTYRLSLVGGNNTTTVVGGPTNFSYQSWGLKAFAMAPTGG